MTERGLKNINVFYSTFTNVFFCHVFFTFFNVFYFFLERFLHLCYRRLFVARQHAYACRTRYCSSKSVRTFVLLSVSEMTYTVRVEWDVKP